MSGRIIASDVTGEMDMSVRDDRYGERPVWWLLWQRMRGTPSIVSILMRSGTVGSEAQRRLVREQADYLYRAAAARIWDCATGRLSTAPSPKAMPMPRAIIEKNGVPLTDVWSEGPAVAMPQHGETQAE